jgi:DNA gyrase subunit A
MEESNQPIKEKVVQRVIEEEMQRSYLDYSMSVIVGRALPDVRDGLKPAHRRVLFAMHDMGMLHNKPFKKCARIVGEVLGKYHPHGDMAVYDTLVRMAQDFSLRYPLIQGQGNFGSVDGDSAAAMRYTEARLNKLAEEILTDIDKETVKFVANFDGSLQEPTVLPAKLPNLLVNGSSGIAVGMATNIPPHNLSEVADGIIAVIDNPEIEAHELMEYVPAPDFPTGGIICGKQGIIEAYKTGKGKLVIRAKTIVEELKNRQQIIVNEIPYQVNKSLMIEQIAELVSDKKIMGISDIRDESDREGMRIVIELKQDALPEVVLNQLFKHSKMQVTFGVIMLSLVDNKPRVLPLKDLIQYYIQHRQIIVRKRTDFELKKAEQRAHILEGLIIALNNIDEVIALIRKSRSVEQARDGLLSRFKLSTEQAQAILDMRLQRLTSLEQDKVKIEHKELLKLIAELKSILASEQKILNIIKQEVAELKITYGDARRTVVEDTFEDLEIEDLIKEEDMVVTVTHEGYMKRLPIDTYKQQKRGGKGIIATETREGDFVEHVFIANTHSYILFFTDKGKVHWLKVYQLPEAGRQSKGRPIVNLLNLEQSERITAFTPVKQFNEGYIVMATKKGIIKRSPLQYFANPRKGGIIAITLSGNDQLIKALLTDGKQQIMLATKKGRANKFNEKDITVVGRTAQGVRGIRLKEGDELIDMVLGDDSKTLLTITQNGYGKRTQISDYRLINRGGSGVRNIICSERNGGVVAVRAVVDEDEMIFISNGGMIIRTAAGGISVIGRNTQGVTLMKLEDNDRVVSAGIIQNND